MRNISGGASPDVRHTVYSVTKSVASTLVAIALEKELIQDLDMPILDFFPSYRLDIDNMSEWKEQISLRHVLEMQAGFEWDEWSTSYDSPSNPTVALARSSDWLKFVLDLPVVSNPGTRFTYNSGCSMLISGVIERISGQTAADFASASLFEPIGIRSWSWDEGPRGLTNTGWGLRLRPRDMARLGQLFLNEGRWEDEQVVPRDWVVDVHRPSTLLPPDRGYKLHWWSRRGALFAVGWGGQYIYILPDHDMVVVTTAENWSSDTDMARIVDDYVLAARAPAGG